MRSASPRCGKATTTRWPARKEPPRARSRPRRGRARRSPAAAPRRRTAARCGNGSSSVAPSRRGLRRRPPPRPAAPRRLEDEVRAHGRAAARGRPGLRRASLPPPGAASSRQVEAALGGREERRSLDRMQRALRERREGADRSISSPKNSIRAARARSSGRRRRAAADSELPALLDAVHTLVAGERELLGEAVDAGLVAASSIGRAARRGRQPLGERAREAQTSPPRASTSSARARSPTRCGGGASPDSQATPRLGSRPTASSPRNQAAASAASRASASSGSRHDEAGARAARGAPRARAAAQTRTRGAGRQRVRELCEALVSTSSRTKA